MFGNLSDTTAHSIKRQQEGISDRMRTAGLPTVGAAEWTSLNMSGRVPVQWGLSLNKFEDVRRRGAGALYTGEEKGPKWWGPSCEKTDWWTDPTENITFATSLAGSKKSRGIQATSLGISTSHFMLNQLIKKPITIEEDFHFFHLLNWRKCRQNRNKRWLHDSFGPQRIIIL